MRILSFAAATILCGMGCTLYGVGAVSTNSLAQQQPANQTSADTTANIQKLSSADAKERTEAACRLGKARAVEPLRNALNDPDANVRKQARWALDLRELKMGKRTR